MKKIIMALVTLSVIAAVVIVPHVIGGNKKQIETPLPANDSKPVYNDYDSENKSTSEFPENETVVSVSMKDGTLSWQEVSGVSAYSIYRSVSKDSGYQKIGVSNDNTYIDESSLPGVTYYYKYGYELPQNTDDTTNDDSTISETTIVTTKATTSSATTRNATTTRRVTTTKITTAKVTTTKQSATYTNPSTSAKMITGFEQHMLDVMNAERKKNGVSPLSFDPQLTSLARLRASELTVYYSANHNRPDKRAWNTVFDDYNYPIYYAGENIAYGQKSADEVMKVWIASPGHYSNIVNPNFGHVGLACYEKNGVLYWEQLFTD